MVSVGKHFMLHIVWDMLRYRGAPGQEIWCMGATDMWFKNPGRCPVEPALGSTTGEGGGDGGTRVPETQCQDWHGLS